MMSAELRAKLFDLLMEDLCLFPEMELAAGRAVNRILALPEIRAALERQERYDDFAEPTDEEAEGYARWLDELRRDTSPQGER